MFSFSQQPSKTLMWSEFKISLHASFFFLKRVLERQPWGGFFKSSQLTMGRHTIESGQMGTKTCTFLGHLLPKNKNEKANKSPSLWWLQGQQVSEHCKSRILLSIFFVIPSMRNEAPPLNLPSQGSRPPCTCGQKSQALAPTQLLPPVLFWARTITSTGLNFPLCKVGIIKPPGW